MVFLKNKLLFITLSLLLSTFVCLAAEVENNKLQIKATDDTSSSAADKQHQNKRGLSEHDAHSIPQEVQQEQQIYSSTAYGNGGGFTPITAGAHFAGSLPVYATAPAAQIYSKAPLGAFQPLTSGYKLATAAYHPSATAGLAAFALQPTAKLGFSNFHYPQLAYASQPSYYSGAYQNFAPPSSYFPSSTFVTSHAAAYPLDSGLLHPSAYQQAAPVYSTASSVSKLAAPGSGIYSPADIGHFYAAPQYAAYQLQAASPLVATNKQYVSNLAGPATQASKPIVGGTGAISYASFAQHSVPVAQKGLSPVPAPALAVAQGSYKLASAPAPVYAQIPVYPGSSVQYGSHLFPSKLGLIQTSH